MTLSILYERIQRLQADILKEPPISEINQRRLEKKIRLEFNYNSNHLEGNTLTYGETELLLYRDKSGNTAHDMRELEEMKAHDLAYHLIQDWAKEKNRPLIENDIKSLHKTILVRSFWKNATTPTGEATRKLIQAGTYKETPNSVLLPNVEMFEYTSPLDTPLEMQRLISWYHEEEYKSELPPIVLAALLHYKFVRIHPFDDGNGRMARLLMNYVLLKHDLPPVIIKSAEKKQYLNALNQADTGNIEAFTEYIATQLLWSLELMLKATRGENIEEADDLGKEIELLKRDLKQKEAIEFSKDKAQIRKQLIKMMISLFEKADAKLKTFDELFSEAFSKIYIDNDAVRNRGISFRDADYSKELQSSFVYLEGTRYISYIRTLKDFRYNRENIFSIEVLIIIFFDMYKYIIKYGKDEISLLNYESISEQQENEIVSSTVRSVLEQIEKMKQ